MLIGELSRRSGVSARMLRHYDALGLVTPSGRTAGGYRDYSDADRERLFQVESLRSLGLSLAEVRRALDQPGVTPAVVIEDLVEQTRERIARETELLDRLRRVGESSPAAWADVLRIVLLLREAGSEHPALRLRAALSTDGRRPMLPADVLAETLLAEADPNVAGALRWALADLGSAGVPVLAAGLDSPASEVRLRAVRALAEITAPEALAALETALRSGDGPVRRHAALALGGRGRPEAVPVLLEMVEEGTSDIEAAETLGRLADAPDRADALTGAVVARLGDPDVPSAARLRLVQALAELPGHASSQAVAELVDDRDAVVALTASAIHTTLRGRRTPHQ